MFGIEKRIKSHRNIVRNSGIQQLRENLAYLRDQYGLKIRVGRQDDEDEQEGLQIDKLDLFSAVRGLEMLRKEIGKYPPSYIKSLHISRFRLCKKLKRPFNYKDRGFRLTGLECAGQIYLAYGNDFQLTVHHELMHRFDRVRPVLYWVRRRYLGQNVYVGEDRATVAEVLMVNPKKVFQKTRKDKAFYRKLAVIIKDFNEYSGGLMDFKYFEDLQAGKFRSGYWSDE